MFAWADLQVRSTLSFCFCSNSTYRSTRLLTSAISINTPPPRPGPLLNTPPRAADDLHAVHTTHLAYQCAWHDHCEPLSDRPNILPSSRLRTQEESCPIWNQCVHPNMGEGGRRGGKGAWDMIKESKSDSAR